MKRTLILFFILLIFGCVTTEKREITEVKPFFLGEVKGEIINNFNNKSNPSMIQFRYIQKKNDSDRIIEKLEIYYNDYIYRTAITINEKDRKKMLGFIEEYKNYENKAKKDKEQTNKELGVIKSDISWNKTEDKWIEATNCEMIINIVPSGMIAQRLEIMFSEAISDNEKYRPGKIIIKEKGIDDLLYVLSDKNFNKEYERAKASK